MGNFTAPPPPSIWLLPGGLPSSHPSVKASTPEISPVPPPQGGCLLGDCGHPTGSQVRCRGSGKQPRQDRESEELGTGPPPCGSEFAFGISPLGCCFQHFALGCCSLGFAFCISHLACCIGRFAAGCCTWVGVASGVWHLGLCIWRFAFGMLHLGFYILHPGFCICKQSWQQEGPKLPVPYCK